MNLLVITQKVDKDDSNLGFFHEWLIEFAKNFEKIIVVCLFKKTKYDLPSNIKVVSLGKERNGPKLKFLFNFYKIIWRERKNYDFVFVHMTPIYVALGGFFWRLYKKKVSLWFTHKSVTIWLYLAEKFCNVIFTATPGSFRLASKKVKVVGHGIDLKQFKKQKIDNRRQSLALVTVGRISPVKDYETLIKALEFLKEKNIDFNIDIIGAPVLDADKVYLEKLKTEVKNKDLNKRVKFIGGLSQDGLIPRLQSADVFVHMSRTGSLDKTILEAMATGLLIVSCNSATKEVVDQYKNELIFKEGDAKQLADCIQNLRSLDEDRKNKIRKMLSKIVEQNELSQLIGKIKKELK